MKLGVCDPGRSALVELPVDSKNDPRILERLVRPALPERLTQEDEGTDLDDPGGDVGVIIEDNEVSRARSGRIEELEFHLRIVGESLPIDLEAHERLAAPKRSPCKRTDRTIGEASSNRDGRYNDRRAEQDYSS